MKSSLEKTHIQLEKFFSQHLLEEGRRFQESGNILDLRHADGLLKGQVRDVNGLFQVYVDLRQWPSSKARCTCSFQWNCKHAAACLLAFKQNTFNNSESLQQKSASTSPGIQLQQPLPKILLNPDTYKLSEASFKSETQETSPKMEWFSKAAFQSNHGISVVNYELGILFEDQVVQLVPLILQLIETSGKRTLLHLSDSAVIQFPLRKGQTLDLPYQRIKPLVQLLLAYNKKLSAQQQRDMTAIEIKQSDLILMQEMEDALAATSKRWLGTQQLRSQLNKLLEKQNTVEQLVDCPLGLKAHLRDYQQVGLSWLQSLRENGFSGILADEMGLGKTIQVLAHLQLEKEANRLTQASLIIVPTTLLHNWFNEFKRFAPALKILIFHGSSRGEINFDEYDIIISSYGLISRDKLRFIAYTFYYLILDEAQYIKNTQTKTRQVVQQLSSIHRLCLSGTPFENHLGELWSLFHFLMPGLLGDAKAFQKFFKNPIESQRDKDKLQLLYKRIQPFLLRRTKQQVTAQLPEKTEIIQRVELAGPQRDVYEVIRSNMEEKIRQAIEERGFSQSRFVFLDALLKLRQICCDPQLLKLEEASVAHGHSAKLKALMTLLDNLVEEKHAILVFSQFTSMLDIIAKKLDEKKYSYLVLTGKTKHRAQVIEAFQSGEAPIFLISLKAGGVGLNLTRADTVIHYDPWWNPALEDQANDRSHRIGQQNPVFIYKLIISNSVEEAILNLQDKKQALVDGLLKDGLQEGFSRLSLADLEHFFISPTKKEAFETD